MSKRTDIIAALEARLKTITIAHGYQTDIGSHVTTWRVSKFLPAELPALNIKYAVDPDTIDGEGMSGPKNVWNRSLPVGITMLAKGTTTIADIEKMIGDVWKAISTDDGFSGNAITVTPESEMIIEDQEERLIAGAIITFKIEYRTTQYGI